MIWHVSGRLQVRARDAQYSFLRMSIYSFLLQHDRCCRRRHQRHGRIQERSGLEMYTVSSPTSSLLPRWRATSSRRVGFGRCSPSTTSTTPRTSPFPNPRGLLVSVSSRSGRIRKLLPQLRVCVFRLVTMVRIWCTRSLDRLNLLDFLLRHNALVGGHPGLRKKTDEQKWERPAAAHAAWPQWRGVGLSLVTGRPRGLARVRKASCARP